jgi:prephenate dehydrogenase
MKVLIVGLGLLGGAYAYRLFNKGYTVYGSDINMDSIDYALEKKYISIGYVHP